VVKLKLKVKIRLYSKKAKLSPQIFGKLRVAYLENRAWRICMPPGL
jgi:hypothetical protein